MHKRDVMKASVMLERDEQWAVILAFDVKVSCHNFNCNVFTARLNMRLKTNIANAVAFELLFYRLVAGKIFLSIVLEQLVFHQRRLHGAFLSQACKPSRRNCRTVLFSSVRQHSHREHRTHVRYHHKRRCNRP